MVRLEEAKKRPRRLPARIKRDSLRLECRTRRLVLEAFGRQARPEWNAELIGVAVIGPHHLAKVGRETRGAFEAPVSGPRIRSPLRQIPPPHQNMIQAWMALDMMVEVLAGVGLVVYQEALIAQPEGPDEERGAR